MFLIFLLPHQSQIINSCRFATIPSYQARVTLLFVAYDGLPFVDLLSEDAHFLHIDLHILYLHPSSLFVIEQLVVKFVYGGGFHIVSLKGLIGLSSQIAKYVACDRQAHNSWHGSEDWDYSYAIVIEDLEGLWLFLLLFIEGQ